jgi:thiamine-phosphate pyrophosphorylase
VNGGSDSVPPVVAPRLVVLTERSLADTAETLRRFERLARAARPWSVMLTLRDRELPASERLTFGRALRAVCARERQWFQVNDRLDLAVLLAADGVHLAESSVSAVDARRLVGPATFVSRACHEPERALEPGVNAWVLSPIFAERKGRAALGCEALTRLAARCRAEAPAASAASRVYALGGVTAPDAKRALDAGAHGVVVMGAVLVADESEALLTALSIRA